MYNMKKQIKTRDDIKFMVDEFYSKARTSEVIGHFFNEVADVNWEKHMPTMYDFWSDILLSTSVYKGNPMTKHFALNEKSKMNPDHFQEWISLWKANLSEHFEGEKADEALARAENIARLMEYKVSNK